jgi:uncharacterized surface protein with fasciclin (FAS1) repeats/ribose 5-phosphate isomerase RpiB
MRLLTFLFLIFFTSQAISQAPVDLPVSFDVDTVNYDLVDFGGNQSSIVVDPTDPSNMVAQSVKTDVAELWAGTTVGTNGFANPIPFVGNATQMRVRVWSPDAGIPVRLKVEDSNNAAISVETEAMTMVAMAWDTLIFDFSNEVSGTAPLNLANTYNKASIFFNFGTDGATAGEKTYFWDDVEFIPPSAAQIALPVTFEDAGTDYDLVDFGGNASSIVADPTNPSNTVAQTTKTDMAEVWAGTTMGNLGFATPIPFVGNATQMRVRVWSPDAGIPVRLKVEDANNAAISVETETLTAVAMAWDTLVFDFSNEVSGTAPLNLSNTYSKASIFFNFGTDGATAGEKTYYWDDVEFIPPTGAQVDLPVTFEDAGTDYDLVDFGGNASSIVTDPTDPSNTVAQSIKTDAAELWAGTSMGNNGFATAIPFALDATQMSVRVWSPDAGIPVRLKVEDSNNPAISVETETLTAVAMEWDTLVFDFSNEVSGTAPLNLANTYNKASIFFNFGTDGATAGEKIYFWDDVQFVPGSSDPNDSQYCQTEVTHLGIPAEIPSKIFLTITNVDATSMLVEIESADMDTVDFLLVIGGSGAMISDEDFSVPGKISRTLSWATPPADVTLNVLWSKVSFGGNWQLSPTDITVPFAAECGDPPLDQVDLPITFDDAGVDYKLVDFGGNASSIVVDPTDGSNMVVESIKTDGAQTFAGTTAGDDGLANPIPFAGNATQMRVRVWSPDAGIPVRLKVEDANDPAISVETETLTAVAMAWDTLVFNFSNEAPGTAPLNLANTYSKVTIFFNFGTDGATAGEKTYYWDDVEFIPPTGEQIDLPVTFEDSDVDYDLVDFGGNASSIVVDPTDPTNTVAQSIKTDAAVIFAGTTMGLNGFANAIPFAGNATQMSVRVWSPDAGIPVRLKVEDANDAAISVETETLTTVAMAWDTLVFDFTNEVSGTAPLNLANTYSKATIFFNFGTDGATAGEKTYFWDDVQFLPPSDKQIDLPVTFEDPDTDYDLVDFGGNASSIVEDPTDPTNTVAQSIKTDVAEVWAGTTMGLNGFKNVIPFTANETQISVRVWSPDADTPVRLKVEDANNAAISVETETLTTVAMEWETLVFDFTNEVSGTAPLNLDNTYSKASIFFNFGTDGATAGEKTYYWDDVQFIPVLLDQIDLPVTFEDPDTDYDLVDFGGNASSIVVDPTDPTNTVAQSIKTDAAVVFAGTTMGLNGFANPIPFAGNATQMRVRVWSPDADIPVRLKVENADDPAISVETETLTTVAMEWDTLVFDFANPVAGTPPINFGNTYSKATIFFNFGTDGATAGEKTYFWDDVEFIPPTGEQIDLPVTFEDPAVDYDLVDFGGNASSIVTDPTDPTNTVAQSIKTDAAVVFAGTTMGLNGFANVIPFEATATKMSVRVWSPDAGIPVRLKAENANDPAISVETETLTTVAMEWDTLVFDFTNEVPGTAPINFANTYSKCSIFFNFGTDGATAGEKTYFWDDVEFLPSGLKQIDLPVTFEDPDTDYDLVDFGGNASSIVEDPTDPTNTVGQSIKTDMAEVWAGTTMGNNGFANPVPFTSAATQMTVRVWSPDAGIPVRLKVEDANDPAISVETETLTTVAMEWETLTFDFSNEAPGTAPLNLANVYSKCSIFFNFGTDGATAGEKTYYWDDVEFIPVILDQIDLPVTFEDPMTDYDLVDFGGNASQVVEDPTDPANTVAQSIKTDAAEVWAGTTMGLNGFANPIPFAPGETKMTVRVWSPDAGTPIRLKAEDAADPTISVETETLTTVAMEWETLEFDFSNEVVGTAAINFANTYDKASIFFNFGTDGPTAGEKTYFWDDVQFGGLPIPLTVYDIIENSMDHDTLEAAILAAELDDDLESEGPFTVFAPTDNAFAALPPGVLDDLLMDPTGTLAQILLYHVHAGAVSSSELSDGQMVSTLQGESMSVTIDGTDVFVNDAQVIIVDLEAENGLVHVIDAVLSIPVSTNNLFGGQGNTMTLFPNPANVQVNLNLETVPVSPYRLKIYDATGRLMLDQEHSTQQLELSTSTLNPGTYWIQVEMMDKVLREKLIIQR